MKNPICVMACAWASCAWLLTACASFSPDGGFGEVSALTRERTGHGASWQRSAAEVDVAQARIAELLLRPMTADTAVEVALVGNRGLQAKFSALGVAESDLVRAGRIANPTFGYTHLSGGGDVEIDRSILVDVLALLTMPMAREVEQGRFETAQLQAAFDAVGVAAEARRAFYGAVAAQQLLAYFEQVKDAADAADELARRMVDAGNFPRLAQMRQQAFRADASMQLARARNRANVEKERLTRVLGLHDEQREFSLPERLPDLPDTAIDPVNVEQTAMDHRLDVLMARHAAAATARQLGLTRTTRFVNVLDAGYANKSTSGEARQNGYAISVELPIFDFGAVRTARAEAGYMQSVHRVAEVAVDAQSEVRESYAAYRTAYALARHYRDEVVPLKKRISDENLLRYNGMLLGVFELLADANDQVMSVSASVEALRDHWLAETDLQTALTGRSPRASDAAGDAAR